jgi:hypothetical protein
MNIENGGDMDYNPADAQGFIRDQRCETQDIRCPIATRETRSHLVFRKNITIESISAKP